MKVGITGGIGVGKSIVCKVFSSLGVPIYNADMRAKAIMVENQLLIADLKSTFGEKTYTQDGKLDRRYLAGKVFGNKELLKKLNSIVHPYVGEDYQQWIEKQTAPFTLKEAALMFESGSDKSLDKIICISANMEIRHQRIINRDPQRTSEEISAIIEKQMPQEKKEQLSDFIIYNNEESLVLEQVLEVFDKVLKQAKMKY